MPTEDYLNIDYGKDWGKAGSKNAALLSSFGEYCHANPELRFWQALRDWAEVKFILAVDDYAVMAEFGYETVVENPRDTFYWEGRNS